MKRILTRILMATGIAGPFVAHVAAQDNRTIANIPFAFIVSKTTMPAGRYQVVQWGASRVAFELRNANGRAVFVLLGTQEGSKSKQASITFVCRRNRCVLEKIAPDSSTEYSSGRDSAERNLHDTFGMASMVSIKLITH